MDTKHPLDETIKNLGRLLIFLLILPFAIPMTCALLGVPMGDSQIEQNVGQPSDNGDENV